MVRCYIRSLSVGYDVYISEQKVLGCWENPLAFVCGSKWNFDVFWEMFGRRTKLELSCAHVQIYSDFFFVLT